MLDLRTKVNQNIAVTGPTVTDIESLAACKLAFDAPKEVSITRLDDRNHATRPSPHLHRELRAASNLDLISRRA